MIEQNFEKRWAKNKDLYGLVKVTEEAARAIWSDAVFTTERRIRTQITKILKDGE